MSFKPAIWFPIAILLTLVNLVGVVFAVEAAQEERATIHAMLAVAFAVWAHRLRQGPAGSELPARLKALEAEVSELRQELSETQERLDFAERLLAQGPETGRLGSEGWSPKQPGESR